MTNKPELPFNEKQSWPEKVFSADSFWAQVEQMLTTNGKELPTTARRPDVRMVLQNTSDTTANFLNPGDYTGGAQEKIPSGKAAMVMLQGDTLEEQQANAQQLEEEFNLGENGLSQDFCEALGNGRLSHLVKEAYGPSEFEGQTSKLVSVNWDRATTSIDPVVHENCSYGARAPSDEKVFAASFVMFVEGTDTSAEQTTPASICVAVESDWQTQKISTRPIQVDVAQGFYGSGFDNMPSVVIDVSGNVLSLDLRDGSPVITRTTAVNAPASKPADFDN